MSLLDTASLVVTPNGTKAGKLYSVVPSSGAGDLDVTRATTATRVNSSGLIQSVASNVPRLDYSNGSCPSILVEPQRTNLVLYSEDFTNVNWIKESSTITSNATVSPDGNTTADKVIASAIGGDKYIAQIITVSSGVVYTSTAYYKASQNNLAWMRLGGVSNNPYVIYNLTTQAIVSTSGLISSSITPMANGWFKVTATVTTTSNLLAPCLFVLPATGYTLGGDNIPEFTGNGTDGGFIWGAQLEAGSYATSYIPTTSASVTRNADVISKTGISSLIGQTEGTMFLDLDFNSVSQVAGVDTLVTLNNGTNNNEISILVDTPAGNPKSFLGLISNAGTYQCLIYDSSLVTATRYKVALAYKNNDIALYINGSLIGTDTSATIPATSVINFNSRPDNSWLNLQQEYVNLTALWKTRLTNTQLAQLTTI